MKKKILHLNFSDTGGAGIAVRRIHECIKNPNIESKILVVEKNTSNDDILVKQSKINYFFWQFKKKISRNLKFINFVTKNKNTHSINILNSNIKKQILQINPDLIFIHWIGNEMISLKQIFELEKIKKIWVLHDMWLYCGAEHYTESIRFIEGYNKSNKPYFEKGFDLNLWNWERKKKYIKNDEIIATSDWQYKNATKSQLLRHKKIYKINLPINTNYWKPENKKESLKKLHWSENNINLIFGFESYSKKHQKGLDIAINLFENLSKISKKKIYFNIFGEVDKNIFLAKDINFLGRLDETELKVLFSASDVLIAPSRLESFGQIALEALACGLPVICKKNTGTEELVTNKKMGFVIHELNIQEYIKILDWINKLNNEDRDYRHDEVNKKYSYRLIQNEYYTNILNKLF
jgi:glycosyltransferase involved in cell wall biosynthesis